MTTGAFGEHLKREREMRGVSLEEISAATRISTRFLEALENEEWDQLPGGVFNRGFVRAVARFLGLDEEDLVAEYALATSYRPAAAVWATNPTTQDGETRRLAWLVALLAVALVAAGWFAWHRYAAARAARKAASSATLGQARRQSFGAAPSAAANASQTATLPAAVPLAQQSAKEPATLELKIETDRPTAVRVTADDKSVFAGKMAAGQSQRFQAQEKFEVWARNANALLLELNGQTLPPLGPPGRPAKATLTRKDLKKAPGGPD